MRFGPVPLAEAGGAILAHTHRLAGGMLRKGITLDAGALTALHSAGYASVVAARLDPGDVGEDEAARRLGDALFSPGLTPTAATTGRVNLAALQAGLLTVDTERLATLNAVDEALTVGTLAGFTPVTAGTLVATIKVIPFAAPGETLTRAEAIAREVPILRLHPFAPLRTGLVLTRLPGLKDSILAGTVEATAARVAGYGGTLLPARICAHEAPAIAAELGALVEDGAELLLVAGASAVVDRRDVGPSGIVAAGGEILHFGMPVDPGNLICLGRIGHRPALVLPGCARSPALNGIDFVLARLFAGVSVDMASLGAGGLLKDVGRPVPRTARVAAPPRVAAVVLAAGRSSRMAPRNKLLLPGQDGAPMVRRVVEAALASAARPVIVVLGNQAEAVLAALGGLDVTFVTAADYAAGLSASLRAGIGAVPAGVSGAMVCLGDMPLIGPEVLDALIAAHGPGRIAVPTWQGRPGNPVLWDRRYFPELAALQGDVGGRVLLERHAGQITSIPTQDDAVLRDFDTVESLATLPEELRPALL